MNFLSPNDMETREGKIDLKLDVFPFQRTMETKTLDIKAKNSVNAMKMRNQRKLSYCEICVNNVSDCSSRDSKLCSGCKTDRDVWYCKSCYKDDENVFCMICKKGKTGQKLI
jgi:hypothetical protein